MRTKIGLITSAKMDKTVTVTVHRYVMHRKYGKRYRVSKKFLADTEGFNDLKEGDEVMITECRPLSKRKYFRVSEVKKRALQMSQVVEEEIERSIKRDHRDRLASKTKDASPAKP